MKITIFSLFPEMYEGFLKTSIIKRAISLKQVEINVVDFRVFSQLKHHQVDDTPYGGGAGMVISIEPIVAAIRHYKTEDSRVILLSAQGKTFNQAIAKDLTKYQNLILIAGHYEGFDERIIHYVDEIISIGDYVLTGGELATMVMTDAIVRLVEQVINKESLLNESFEDNLLDYEVYTKPVNFENHLVPEVYLSGDHKKISEARKQSQINKTKKYRFDLYQKYLRRDHNGKK